ncbi:hypothetical protein ACIPPS_11855 [Streptomyces sp. NPDC090127]|uniref:hypothetical protein n=1 Tax=Streptomyces sp. NPDC090127 TaxID=3365953 RepID=UPI0037FC7E6E
MNVGEIREHPPIYDRLVEERGDVLAEARHAAELARHQSEQALDWSSLRPSAQQSGQREGRAFSAFG